MLGATTGYRRGTLEAIHHARNRRAFGALLVDQPAMRTCSPTWRLTRRRRPRRRCASPAPTTRGRGPPVPAVRDRGHEVLDLQAGARPCGRGARVPRRQRLRRGLSGCRALPRRADGSIWEGSGNVAALDVLRALAREPEAVAAFRAECGWLGAQTVTSIRIWMRSRRPRRPNTAPGARSRIWRLRSRARCSCATRRQSSLTPSASRGSAASRVASTGRCQMASMRRDHRSRPAANLITTGRLGRVYAGGHSRSRDEDAARGKCPAASRTYPGCRD